MRDRFLSRSSGCFDRDGRLHIASAAISKACVSAYRGQEIPGWRELRLDPNKTYQLFRDPDELKKAVKNLNSLRVTASHVPLAMDIDPRLVIGVVGTDARFVDPLAMASIAIWSGRAIAEIEAGRQQSLSLGYSYVADMRPGMWDGRQHFDGVMRCIEPHHITLTHRSRVAMDSRWFITPARREAA
jgi:hypothetical protein